jgi:multiple sugar transport system substrate-binding protein
MRDLIYKYKISPKLVTTANEEMTRHIFGNGKAIFLRNWTYAWNIFQRDDSAIKGKVGITVIPHFYANESVATLGGWQLGINKFSKKKNSAIKFIKYLTSYEIQKFITVNVGLKPTRIDLYYDEELKEKQPFITSLIDIFQKAIPRPVTPLYLMMSQTLQSEFSAIINEIKEPEKALADADEQINYILKNSE